MKCKPFICLLVFIFFYCSCKKDAGPKGDTGNAGADGYNSLISITSTPPDSVCTGGGVLVQSGIDKNKNNVLDAGEIEDSERVCNGSNAESDKQIFIPIPNAGAITTSKTPVITGTLLKFNKVYYSGVDSIILVANPYVYGGSNTSVVELYDITDGQAIAGSSLSSGYSGDNPPFIQTGNLYNSLPDKEITLGIRSYSANEGIYAATGSCYLFLYRN